MRPSSHYLMLKDDGYDLVAYSNAHECEQIGSSLMMERQELLPNNYLSTSRQLVIFTVYLLGAMFAARRKTSC